MELLNGSKEGFGDSIMNGKQLASFYYPNVREMYHQINPVVWSSFSLPFSFLTQLGEQKIPKRERERKRTIGAHELYLKRE